MTCALCARATLQMTVHAELLQNIRTRGSMSVTGVLFSKSHSSSCWPNCTRALQQHCKSISEFFSTGACSNRQQALKCPLPQLARPPAEVAAHQNGHGKHAFSA
ncbi:MAG TPA: hypothetical protein DIT89_01520 [Planctomycetaceae bacterium]|nr:hypothetical protein [Planctomycetaceae bacterium]